MRQGGRRVGQEVLVADPGHRDTAAARSSRPRFWAVQWARCGRGPAGHRAAVLGAFDRLAPGVRDGARVSDHVDDVDVHPGRRQAEGQGGVFAGVDHDRAPAISPAASYRRGRCRRIPPAPGGRCAGSCGCGRRGVAGRGRVRPELRRPAAERALADLAPEGAGGKGSPQPHGSSASTLLAQRWTTSPSGRDAGDLAEQALQQCGPATAEATQEYHPGRRSNGQTRANGLTRRIRNVPRLARRVIIHPRND